MSVVLDVRRPDGFTGLELTAFAGHNYEFSPSFLTDFNFGVRLKGVRETRYRGERFRSGPGTFLAYAPGAVLAAKPLTEGPWHYLDMTLPPALLGTLLETDPSRLERTPLHGVNESTGPLFAPFVESHLCIRRGAPQLEQETKLLAWLAPLFKTTDGVRTRHRREHRAVKLVQTYLHDNLARNVSLEELSRLVGLNKQYLLRVFKWEHGLTPYQYQTGLRLAQAKNLLWRGLPPAQVAVEIGFYDQSALNKFFKRHNFVTPGAYRTLVSSHGQTQTKLRTATRQI